MDIDKLFRKVINTEKIKSIPLVYVLTVMEVIIEAIGSGECFYKTEHD